MSAVDRTSKPRTVHAMNMGLEVLCGRPAKCTSIVRRPYERDKLSKLVTCKTCLRIMRRE